MTIREELLSEGYTDEYIDKASKMEYQKIVDEIQNRKKSRLTRISNHLKISYYINRLIKLSAWKSTLKSGNKDINDNDINKIDSMSLQDEEIIKILQRYFNGEYIGNLTVTFQNEEIEEKFKKYLSGDKNISLEFNYETVLSTPQFDIASAVKNVDIHSKRLLADYLNMNEEEIINMDSEEILIVVKKRNKTLKFTK
jgi:hypothetical protein